MNHDLFYQRMCETAWRRKLTDAEQTELRAWLDAHPDAQVDWENELELSDSLTRLPDVPMPSNFTARVLQAIEGEDALKVRERTPRRTWVWRVFVPRFALVILLAGAGWFAYQWHARVERIKLAQSVAVVASVRSLPSPQVLEDFDAIACLPPMPPADNDLLALMK